MRGTKEQQNELFSYISIESRVAEKHPLRRIREITDEVLLELSRDFEKIYSHTGRPSIPPEILLKASLLQILYGIRSERLLLEQIEFNLLYRWFLGLSPDDKIWDESVFTKNRERLLGGEIADKFMAQVVNLAKRKGLVSGEHFTVDGTLVEAWASLKSLQPKDGSKNCDDDGDGGNPSVDFKGTKRKNDTHESKTDPDSRIYTKARGVAAKLNFMGHVLMENRNGLAVNATVNTAGFYSECDAALEMVEELRTSRKKTLGADKAYDDVDFCEGLREHNVTPHVAQNIHIRHPSAIDDRTTRHPGYGISTRKRKRVEEIFGWLKQWGPFRRQHFRGMPRVSYFFTFSVAAYNILRIANLMASPGS
jgi:transposase